jgi:glycosyltransferase involved in cell wall biosynthesis
MIKSPTIAIIVPAYNEALVIGNVLSSLNTRLSKTKYRYSIIVVDDGSSDTTAKIAKKTKIKVISHIINSGAGSAIATGIKYAKDSKFDLAATFDADGQHNPDDLVKGIDIICRNNYDLLIGSRLINSNGMSVTKVVGNKGLSLVTNFLFGIKITDSQSGLRILSNKALQSLSWRSNGFEYCSCC